MLAACAANVLGVAFVQWFMQRRLVCTLLLGCGCYFLKGRARRRLDAYLLYLQVGIGVWECGSGVVGALGGAVLLICAMPTTQGCPLIHQVPCAHSNTHSLATALCALQGTATANGH